jgi:mono/diheme cytochrome c family protein
VAGVLVVIAGLGVALALWEVSSRRSTPREIDARPNPIPPTQASLALGERIYRAQCQVCHGVDGYGNGPAAATLYPPPTDFVVHFASGHTHTDGRLYYWITYGIAGTAMPAYRDRLSDTERWHVVNFLRTFTPAER